MKAQKAVELARRMTVLCHFPSGENGIEQVARLLLDICDSDKAGEQLVSDVIRHCDEWPAHAKIVAKQYPIRQARPVLAHSAQVSEVF